MSRVPRHGRVPRIPAVPVSRDNYSAQIIYYDITYVMGIGFFSRFVPFCYVRVVCRLYGWCGYVFLCLDGFFFYIFLVDFFFFTFLTVKLGFSGV